MGRVDWLEPLLAEVAEFEQVVVLAEVGGVTFQHQVTMGEDVRAVGDLQSHVHVLLDEQHAGAGVVSDLAKDREELLDDDGRKSEAELVDHEQLGAGGKRSADGEHLLLTAGEQSCLAIHQWFERGK